MKILSILLALFFLGPASVEAQDQQSVMRDFIWGLSRQDILEFEKADLVSEEPDWLYYADKIVDLDSFVGFYFFNQQLSKIEIAIMEQYSSGSKLMDDLLAVQSWLENQYGKADSETFYWIRERYKKQPDRWGLAILRGHLRIDMRWITDENIISLILKGQDYKQDFRITAESRPLKALKADQDNKPAKITP